MRTESSLPGAVIFDMDGVLADTEPLHAKCFTRAFAGFGIEATPEEYRQAVTIAGSTVRDFFVSLGGDPSDWDRLKQVKDAYMQDAMEHLRDILPGVTRLLELLRSAAIPTAIATSARRKSLDIIIDRFGLRPYFDLCVTKDEVAAEKPAPDLYLLAAQKLGVDPAQCVALEDSPRGVAAAIKAGMKCIAIPVQSTIDGDFSQATLIVRSLEEVDLDTLQGLM